MFTIVDSAGSAAWPRCSPTCRRSGPPLKATEARARSAHAGLARSKSSGLRAKGRLAGLSSQLPGGPVKAGVPTVPAGSARTPPAYRSSTTGRISMAVVSMRELLEAGVHFGHQTRRWNPKMKRFIFAERGGIYIIDLQQTLGLLEEAHAFVHNLAERNGTVLFVGTKKQAQDAIEEQAKRVGMPYVNHRWLGGLLTNWRTTADRVDRPHDLRRQKEDGQLDLLPAKERIAMLAELTKLDANLGGVADLR